MARGSSGGGESKQGLIITLIFFILATIILGVTTYLGFDGQGVLKQQADAANDEKAKWEAKSNWHELGSKVYRAYGSGMLAKDAERLGQLREQFDTNKFASVDDPARDDIIRDIREKLDRDPGLGWNAAEKKPKENYAGLVAKLNKQIADLTKNWEQEKANVKKATDDLAAAQDDLRKYRAEWEKKVKLAEANILKEQEKVREQLAMLQTQLDDIGKEREDVKGQMAKLLEDTGKKVADLNKKLTDQGLKLAKAEAEVGKKIAAAIDLNQPHGKVVSFDPSGERPFINLGALDNVKTGLTFSVFGVGPDGKALKEGKATLEVVRIINDHLSQTQITGYADRYRDPILPGDLLFNPSWSPTQKKHVAVVGVIDLDGDGADDIQEFLRGLGRHAVTVDAWLDLKTLKEEGMGLGRGTEYLVLGDNPPPPFGGREDDERNKRHQAKMDAMAKMQQKAVENGVTIIHLRNFLRLTGYPVPRTGPIFGAVSGQNIGTAGSPIEKIFEKKDGPDKPGPGVDGRNR